MATFSLYYSWEIPLNDRLVSGGSRSLPITVTAAGNVKHDASYTVATATAKVLLNLGATATDDIADFDVVVITSNKDGWIEVLGTTAADNSNFPVKANVPFFLGYSANGTRAYNAAGGFAGAAQNITKISIYQSSGADATVRVVALS